MGAACQFAKEETAAIGWVVAKAAWKRRPFLVFHEALTDSLHLGGLLLRGGLYSISLDLSPPDAAVEWTTSLAWLS